MNNKRNLFVLCDDREIRTSYAPIHHETRIALYEKMDWLYHPIVSVYIAMVGDYPPNPLELLYAIERTIDMAGWNSELLTAPDGQ